ncbi:MAG TPA: N-acetylmuramoyl-L-alanine amidase [Gammaproteobacteria bacterium]|nr:N-acetylmuramoyl-L-alanine amidase [Gammaproteobacteria bacterium]
MPRLLLILLMLLPMTAAGSTVSIMAVRTWAGPEHTRVVFDLTGAADHTLFTLADPDRVVIDLRNTSVAPRLLAGAAGQGLVQRIRGGVQDRNDLRVVLDLTGAARAKSFIVKPGDGSGHRLVVDLQGGGAQAAKTVPATPVKVLPPVQDELMIAIDAGHGGEDPGAIGPRGTYEKDVVLAVAKKLAQLIAKEPGMRPLLIRDRDVYVPLQVRKEKARKERADIFISLHADAVAHNTAQGASVYTLSRRGASTEAARLLAERENSADLVGGLSLEDKDDLVASVLLDLSRAATAESSVGLADALLGRLGDVGKLHKSRVEHAGFVVLKSLDVPSVLVELAFISNPAEERRLANDAHQWRLARALFAGIRDYRDQYMPPTPRYAQGGGREYVIKAGDTLSAIAQRYQVSLDTLRAANSLTSDMLMVGHTVRIP